jgi:uncharacterized protein (TIGR02147 family)
MTKLFDYLDYRQYLREVFDEKKSRVPHFSHRSLMQKLSLKTPGHMLLVMQGRRNLTADIAIKLASYLKLSKKESEYLHTLVRYTDAKTPAEKQYLFEELLSYRLRSSATVPVSKYRFYEKWYYSAVRAALDVEPFKDDFAGLGATLCPPITAGEAKQAVELLLGLSMAVRDEKGYIRPAETAVSTGDQWQSAIVQNLQRQFIDLGKESLDRFAREERDISNLTVTVSEQTFELIKKNVRELRAKILAMGCAEQAADRVLQVNIQVFPLQKKRKDRQS